MHFICVHGVCHGGWCWDKTKSDLEAQGHTVSAPDLPLTSLDNDASAVRDVLDASTKPSVLVGHSYGGSVISKAAAGRTDVAHLVYVAAIMIGKDEVFAEVSAPYPSDLGQSLLISEDNTFCVDSKGAIDAFYHCCDPQEAADAAARLRTTSFDCVSTPSGAEPWNSIPSTYVLCSQDKAITAELQTLMSQRAATTVTIDTDHSPFYSAPEELLAVLADCG